MNILEEIIAYKKEEVKIAKSQTSISALEQSDLFKNPINISLKSNLEKADFGIIAEHKRKSPSKGIINDKLSLEFVTKGYVNAGARCLSILTDQKFFGGSDIDLIKGRKANPNMPILRKDFIIDEYQIIEAKAWGASVILLIAANLTKIEVLFFAKFAKSLQLEVLLEIHNEVELLEYINPFIDFVGVNNRNLKTFEVNIETSLNLAEKIPSQFIKITESGLNTYDEIIVLIKEGYKGFLIGESFMKTDHPGNACSNLILEVENKLT